LSSGAEGEKYFDYFQILTLASIGGILGVLFMVPLRRSLIVGEHGTLPYPEGTACAEVLVAGEKGGKMAKYVFLGVGFSFLYSIGCKILKLWDEAAVFLAPSRGTGVKPATILPNAQVATEVVPELVGVGYILGPKVGGIMVSGAILTSIVLIPLLSIFIPETQVIADLTALGFKPEEINNWSWFRRMNNGYARYIGAGAVTMAGIITLIKTLPTIVSSIRASMRALGAGSGGGSQSRTERDIPISVVALGSIGLVAVLVALPLLPGSFLGKLMMAVLVLVFGFLFVTVSSRIVGLIGSSSNPISGMTIATLLGTSLVFLTMGLGGDVYQPVALSVGAIVCIAAANAGATSQDLKTGFLVGATPIRQQIGLVIGVLVSVFAIGFTLKLVDANFADDKIPGSHGIGGDVLGAPQAQLMATVLKGVMSQNLPWSYVAAGAGLALMVFLCGVSPLAWAVGAYLPFGTSMSIFIGGLVRGLVDKLRKGQNTESEISSGMLFSTGLVAGGSLCGVALAALAGIPMTGGDGKQSDVAEYLAGTVKGFHQFQTETFGTYGPQFTSLAFLAILCFVLFRVAMKKEE
jgi:putative OPT family oligopeptide transporter